MKSETSTQKPRTSWYRLTVAEAHAALGTTPGQGLSHEEARARLERQGPNELRETSGRSPWGMLLTQLSSTLVIVLLIAATISASIGNLKDAIAILGIVVLNAVLGFAQEHRAERAIAALKKLTVPAVRVRRQGALVELPATALAPGDLVLLEAGNLVPADGRFTEVASLRVQEAMLTGESEAVDKIADALPETGDELALGDRRNLSFMGTTVVYGRGEMLVTETGMDTQLGQVAGMLQSVGPSQTPLQRRLDRFGRSLALIALGLVVLVFGIGVALGEDWQLMLMTAISLAVAVIPEGLPAVVTISLALGAQRMLKRQALIRKLPAVEALGSVTVICTDKTGTLTENRMTVTVIDLAGHRRTLEQTFHYRQPMLLAAGDGSALAAEAPALSLLLTAGALCNDSTLQAFPGKPGQLRALGDPTEGALLLAAAHFGLDKAELTNRCPRIAEVPFDSERKRMSTVHRVDSTPMLLAQCAGDCRLTHAVFAKGAVDSLLTVSDRVWDQGQTRPLDAAYRQRIVTANEALASQGMRVLGVAFRPLSQLTAPELGNPALLERELVFVGMVGMIDPPRPEVRAAVARCLGAGIQPVMITGDHPLTARQIARDLGISQEGRVLTGIELDRLSDAELSEMVERVSVFARVAPEHKLRIVQALQARGHVVAMTGDGVNDAPALRHADIGVAMGITGTDVTKEAASMVLLDDNFTTIVYAVEEGRTIYDNVRKFMKFSLAGNLAKVLVVLTGPILGMPLPFTPFQLLWMNLITDGVLGLGLSVEPAEEGIMRRPPHRQTEGIINRALFGRIAMMGGTIGILVLVLGLFSFRAGWQSFQTLMLTAMIFCQIAEAFLARSDQRSVFRLPLLSNKPLLLAALAIFTLQCLAVYFAPLRWLFQMVPLTPGEFALAAGAALILLLGGELGKALLRPKG